MLEGLLLTIFSAVVTLIMNVIEIKEGVEA